MKKAFPAFLVLAVGMAAASCKGNPANKQLFVGEGQHVLPETRVVELVCKVTVGDIPAEAKGVRLWVPFPVAGGHQRLLEPSIQSPASYRPIIRYDARYGAPVLFVSADAPLPKAFDVEYSLRVERSKIEHEDMKSSAVEPDNVIRERLAAELALPEGVSEPELAAVVAGLTPADNTTFGRARAIYDYVINTLEVDNAAVVPETTVKVSEAAVSPAPDVGTVAATTPGGARVKDILSARRGGASDYALLTVVLMRSAGIPARIESGVMLPEDRTPDVKEVRSRHAWVRFYVPGFGWSVCDPYLADTFPELKAYMFGGACANRVQLGVGPEPGLVPAPQTGLPTVFTDAIAEVDDAPAGVHMRIFFRDVSGGTSP